MTALPTSAPSAQGVDARGVLALLDALDAAPAIEPHSLVVVRHGHVVAQGWWAPYARQRPHLLYSLSKSFTATALGLAVAEGLVGLDDTVLSHFPELDAEVTDPRSRSMLVRHVAAMSSGHTDDTYATARATDPLDLVRGFLLTPPQRDPGTVFAYNQPCTFTLGAIIARASGQSLLEYVRQRLLDPLGLEHPEGVGWQVDASGRTLGFSGLHAPTEAVAKLALLHLQRGRWQGRQRLDAAWVDDATRAHVATVTSGGDGESSQRTGDWALGYGFQFWQSRHGYRGDGAYGQFALVLPEADAVVAITAATVDMQGVLDAVWAHLLPAMGPLDPTAPVGSASSADAELAQRLAGLALPPVTTALPQPPAAGGADGQHATWDGATFDAEPGGVSQASLRRVEVASHGDGWRVALVEQDARLDAALGLGAWAVTEAAPGGGPEASVPVAVSGGWLPDGTLTFDVSFLQTPHRLTVLASPATGTFTARWLTTPLHAASLGDLASPTGARVGG